VYGKFEAVFEERPQHECVVGFFRAGRILSDDIEADGFQPAGACDLRRLSVIRAFNEALQRHVGKDDLAGRSVGPTVSIAGIRQTKHIFPGGGGV
jgi:hypothetical protein